MDDYSYLPQQSEEHFEAHNKNDLNFIEFNPLPSYLICFPIEDQSSRQFQDFWNWFLNEHSAETYTAYTTYYFDQAYFEDNFKEKNNSINQLLYSTTFEQQLPNSEYLNHQIHIWIVAHQATETPLETEEESYQTVPVFDFFQKKETILHYHYLKMMHKIQLNSWMILRELPQPTNMMKNTSFKSLIAISKAFLLLGSHKKLMLMLTQESLDRHQQMLKKKIPLLQPKQKIHSFTKRLRTDLSYALWPLLALKDNSTINMVIELAQRIEDNQRMHLESTLPVLAPASILALASQIAAISFTLLEPLTQAVRKNQQPQRPRFELCFNQSQQPPYQRQQNCGPPVCYHCGLTGHFSRDYNNLPLPLLVPRNNDNQNNRPINNNAPNQRPNHANINFFEEDPLVEATSASQTEKNLFFAFNLTDNDHNIDKLAINTSKSTRKKKKAKVDFILDPNKASTLTADNNKPPKAKVFKNFSKLKPPEIVQKSGLYSIVKDLMETPAHIIFGQLITHLQFRKDLHKSLIPKKKTPKTNKCPHQAGFANNSNVTPLICKAQVAGYFIDLILNSGLSVNIIVKHFLKAIGRKINELST
ncbi:hypothetical protein G9A89_012101 [Geosiphon pyriformis]|nr:hypothetical protein G9A89_012101 [Geosiphon pyriformis]